MGNHRDIGGVGGGMSCKKGFLDVDSSGKLYTSMHNMTVINTMFEHKEVQYHDLDSGRTVWLFIYVVCKSASCDIITDSTTAALLAS